ncbi:MAG TPA: CoA transferase [Halomonas sp.]|jgi:crotonobetainyl-CoA:carnitine CoA-transferase CaiB-like acyl-CoA transferase|uniref:CaiB/BaiF CoA transferase family protein n=1 Tax=Halomonadaceae TaxID=28256 RepID=UPI0006CFCB9B|nr:MULTISPECIES: CaiB/BaiF CoA-transferase family protein [Halomonas]MED5459373.1 CaiB/BaiF CoA-transferase family protein [Pseudomonadota bacterium]MCD1652844.1 CoA transferase [Halomonas axialensis]MCD2089162.1 CoA transferase [Halomonas meridiana]MCF2914534.1 CoA transferase [Halomonas sp. Cn5-12]HAO02378.1 CoA transferase [Halomonas sp.]
MRKPLEGIRVLDMSRVLAGPWCGQQLADMGAEVIKVERPDSGDDTRAWGPPWLAGTRESAYFLSANRGKRSVGVNIASLEGQQLIRDLVSQCDVLIENFKAGGLKAYGLDYASLKVIKPDLIYCSITGFGQDGPYAHRAGYDFIIQGMGGLMSLTGQPDGAPGGEPMKVGVALTDIFTGLYAANAILAALWERKRTGEGGHIDMALLDVQVGVLANQALNYLTSGEVPRRLGNAHPNIVPYQVFPSADGHLIVTVGNDGQFRRFCQVLGCEEWADDPRFATNSARVAYRDALIPDISKLLAMRTTDNWLAELETAGVPCGPINTLDKVFDDPQVRHRGMRLPLPHPKAGQVDLVGNPIRIDGQRLAAETPPPALGEHSEEVLSQLLGLDEETLAGLRERGVIGGSGS